MIVATGLEVLIPLLMGRAVDAVVEGDESLLLRLCLWFSGVYVIQAVSEYLQAYCFQRAGQQITHRLRLLLFEKLQRLPVRFFDANAIGRLQSRVINDVKALGELFDASMSGVCLDFMMLAAAIATMLWLRWQLALVLLSVFPIVLLSSHFFGKKLATAYRLGRKRLAAINGFLGENIGAVATIQRLSAEQDRFLRFVRMAERHQSAQLASVKWFAVAVPPIMVLYGISIGALILVGGHWVLEEKISLGLLVAFFGYVRNMYRPVEDLMQKYNVFLSARVAAERIEALRDEIDEREEEKNPVTERPSQSSIEFRGVSFRYPQGSVQALKNCTFQIESGESVAVVGTTGSGKSTLIRLLVRFYEPQGGQILFAGTPLEQWNRFQLRERISVIHQDVWLFEGTLRDNLALGQSDLSEDALVLAAKRAQLWDRMLSRGGLDAPVNEGGRNFSQGERQLVVFARTFLRNPSVVILDEATASLDRELEERILLAMEDLLKGRTSLIIAHRLGTIRQCQRVLVFEHGELKEQGSPDELLAHSGLFAKFLSLHEAGYAEPGFAQE